MWAAIAVAVDTAIDVRHRKRKHSRNLDSHSLLVPHIRHRVTYHIVCALAEVLDDQSKAHGSFLEDSSAVSAVGRRIGDRRPLSRTVLVQLDSVDYCN